MKLYAPRYYRDFRCIAHRCRHSCCIGWEIDIDEAAMHTYETLTEGYGQGILRTIEMGETPHFRLGSDQRCPHLDEKGLCRIITNLGEDFLCDICREHPRFYHNTRRGKEVGVGMACEEACRLILSSDGYAQWEELGEVEGTLTAERAFDPLPHRDRLYAMLSDTTRPYLQRLHEISQAYRVALTCRSDEEWRDTLSGLEYLEEAHRRLFSAYTSAPAPSPMVEPSLERALAYFIFRHCSDAEEEEDFRTALGFSLLCERLLASLLAAGGVTDAADICQAARVISEEIEYNEDNVESLRFAFLF